jgi:hypothetical protein
MTTSRPPVAAARWAVGLAARLLPTAADRRRYQAEFAAELYGLPVSGQLRQATGALSRALALRAALRDSSTRSQEVGMRTTTPGQRFRCRYLHWHDWRPYSTPDGGRYVACAVCRKEHGGWDSVSGGFMGGAGGGGAV